MERNTSNNIIYQVDSSDSSEDEDISELSAIAALTHFRSISFSWIESTPTDPNEPVAGPSHAYQPPPGLQPTLPLMNGFAAHNDLQVSGNQRSQGFNPTLPQMNGFAAHNDLQVSGSQRTQGFDPTLPQMIDIHAHNDLQFSTVPLAAIPADENSIAPYDLDPLNDLFSTAEISIPPAPETANRSANTQNRRGRRGGRRGRPCKRKAANQPKPIFLGDDIPNEIWDNVVLLESYCEIENQKLQDFFEQNAKQNGKK